jgi:hypothetical protein
MSAFRQTVPTIYLLLEENNFAGAFEIIDIFLNTTNSALNGILTFRYDGNYISILRYHTQDITYKIELILVY